MTRTVAAFARGSAGVGRGPHRLGSLRLHQRTLAKSQAAEEAATDTSAGRRNPGARAIDIAKATSMGAYAGNVATHWPKLVATPFPPRKPLQSG